MSYCSHCRGYCPGTLSCTVYPKKYAHGFVVLCFVVVMQSFIMNSHEVFIHIHQGCFAGTGAIVRLPQCQWSKPDGYGKISQCITTTKHSKAKTLCIFLGIYCSQVSETHLKFSSCKWNLRVPDLQTYCSDWTLWQSARIVVLGMATRVTSLIIKGIDFSLFLDCSLYIHIQALPVYPTRYRFIVLRWW